MERSRILSLVLAAFVVSLAAFVLFVHAPAAQAATPFTLEDIGSTIGLGTSDLKGVIINVLRWVLGILALTAVVFIVYGGFLWLTAAGNPERIQKAKRVIVNAVIGLVIVLISWAIVSYVVKTAANLTSGDGTGGCCLPPGGDDNTFQITAITTDCGDATSKFRNDVFLCSAVNITFNHFVKPETVEQAVLTKQLIIEDCSAGDLAGDSCTPLLPDSTPAGTAVADQAYKADAPTSPGTDTPEWVARATDGAGNPVFGKSVTFYHLKHLFQNNHYFRVTIPKTIQDTDGRALSDCFKNGLPPKHCNDVGMGYQWIMMTGNSVDTIPPIRARTYPSSTYENPNRIAGTEPDRNVPRAGFISITYDQPILPSFTVVLREISEPHGPDWNDGVDGAVVPATDYTVAPSLDGLGIQLAMKAPKVLKEFTWYKVSVSGVRDLCSNLQTPDPFEWVFETNNVLPGIADIYPQNGTADACADTDVAIRYTVSMYDINTGSCAVGASFVDSGNMREDGGPVIGNRTLGIDPVNDCAGCSNPEDRCMVYKFMPPPPYPTPQAAYLKQNQKYQVGVDNSWLISETQTLRFGEPFVPPPPSLGPWSFTVMPPGQCVNRPRIDYIDPPRGTDGQCLTIYGSNLDPTNPGRHDGDDLTYDGATQSSLGWNSMTVVTKAPGGAPDNAAQNPGLHNYQVSADFGLQYGVLPSNTYSWLKDPGPDAQGPCLVSLEPNAGYNNTFVRAHGIDFNPSTTTQQIAYDLLLAPIVGWENERIDHYVPPAAPLGLNEVRVTNDVGVSNPQYFQVNPVPPDMLVVLDQWPVCTASCPNADVGAQFSLDIQPPSLVGNILIKHCQNASCTSFVGPDFTPAAAAETPRRFHFPPGVSLAAGEWYRVVLRGGILGTTPSGETVSLSNLNYSTVPGPADAYSWTFRVAVTSDGCTLNRCEVQPSSAFLWSIGQTQGFGAGAYTEPNACNPAGQLIDPGTLVWDPWSSSDNTKATVAAVPGVPYAANATAVDQTVPGPAVAITERVHEGALSAMCSAYLTVDLTYCNETIDCTKGGTCPGSTCDDAVQRCTPVINSINPTNTDIGEWIDIRGCHFSGYAQGACSGTGTACDSNADCGAFPNACIGGSFVRYQPAARGRWPDGGICGSPGDLWTNDRILSEVPDKDSVPRSASPGPVTIVRWDNQSAINPFLMSFGSGHYPFICKVDPSAAGPGQAVALKGQNFDDPYGSNARGSGSITFYDAIPVDDPAGYLTWSGKELRCTVPNGARNNEDGAYAMPAGNLWNYGEVVVQTGGRTSNAGNLEVRGAGCDTCSNDGMCGAARVCFSGCCTVEPKVILTNPPNGATNVCRNAIMTARFNVGMDPHTMNPGTVHLFAGGTEVTNKFIDYDSGMKVMSIYAGLLERNTLYRVALAGGNLVQNGSFEQMTSPTHPTSWNGTGTQSPDIPSGAIPGTNSIFENPGPSPQEGMSQSVGQSTTDVRTYHVSGWVRAKSGPAGGQGGLITQCWSSDPMIQSSIWNFCTPAAAPTTFDKYNTAPGIRILGPNQDTGWQFIDFSVSNTSGLNIGPQVTCYANTGMQIWCDDIVVTEESTSGLLSSDGVSLKTYQWTFQTADSDGPCEVARVEINPPMWTFSKGTGPESEKDDFRARAFADNGQELGRVPAVYDWKWDWKILEPYVEFKAPDPLDHDTADLRVKLPVTKGRTQLRAAAVAKPGVPGPAAPVIGTSSINVTACEQPWVFLDDDPTPYPIPAACTTGSGASCAMNHFEIGYCRDGGLPNLSWDTGSGSYRPTITKTDPTPANAQLLKEFLFKERKPEALDAIGIRVYNNVENLTAAAWYRKNAPRAASAEPLVIDGYDAVQDGVATYVAATDKFAVGSVVPKIFLLSYNIGASEATVNIARQMLDSWFFNTNVNEACNGQESDKPCMQRDLKRITALGDLKLSLGTYHTANGKYPPLASGSYLPQLSFSVWPSWTDALGGELGGAPGKDPKNNMPNCPSSQAQDGTCWNERNRTFRCETQGRCVGGGLGSDDGSLCIANSDCDGGTCEQQHIFGYRAQPDGSSANLYANFESQTFQNLRNYAYGTNACSGTDSVCACFNRQTAVP